MRPDRRQGDRKPILQRQAKGFTLIELLVVIAVMVIMTTWAVPNFQAFAARNDVAAEVMRLKTALALARNTAVTRRTTVTVCSSPGSPYDTCTFDDWGHDWVIVEGRATSGDLSGDTVLRVVDSPSDIEITFSRSDRPVRYGALGRSSGHNGTFRICGQKETGAQVIVSNFGRVHVEPMALDCE